MRSSLTPARSGWAPGTTALKYHLATVESLSPSQIAQYANCVAIRGMSMAAVNGTAITGADGLEQIRAAGAAAKRGSEAKWSIIIEPA
jgi:hypothetical protein